MNKWYIQVPLHLILLEILVACVLRIVYAIVLINKYRHKREECYKPPILDDNYYGGAPNYASVSPIQERIYVLKAFIHDFAFINDFNWKQDFDYFGKSF